MPYNAAKQTAQEIKKIHSKQILNYATNIQSHTQTPIVNYETYF